MNTRKVFAHSRHQLRLRRKGRFLSLFLGLLLSPSLLFAQGTAFTYQGQLTDGAAPAQGSYDLTFTVFDDVAAGTLVAGPVTNAAVAVSNGLFTTTIDFGPGVFQGSGRWLEIGVATNGSGAFTTLSPRQMLTPSPYAIYANRADSAGVSDVSTSVSAGAVGTAQLDTTGAPTANEFLSFDGANLVWATPSTASGAWGTTGNSGTAPPGNFLGTTDNQPLELRVHGARALRLEAVTNDAPNIIGGASINGVDSGMTGSVIAGGGTTSLNDGNRVSANFSSIGGGSGHSIGAGADNAFLGGGYRDYIGPGAWQSVLAGGYKNTNFVSVQSTMGGGALNVLSNAPIATLAGGQQNFASARLATISGGYVNSVSGFCGTICGGQGNGVYADQGLIGGGYGNYVGGYAGAVGGGYQNYVNGAYGAVAGGYNNGAGYSAFAAGANAYANPNSFCFSDGNGATSGSGTFTVRANSGVQLVSGTGLNVSGYAYLNNGATVYNGQTVYGTLYAENGAVIYNGATVYGAYFYNPVTVQYALGIGLTPANNNAYQLQLSLDLAGKPNGGSWANTSDARIKKNIQPLTGALDKLTQLRGVSFEWRNPQDHANQTNVQSGFIAQEVEQVFPDWVTQIAAAEHDRGLTDDGKVRSLSLPFAYDALVVESIKELHDENVELKRQLAELKEIVLKLSTTPAPARP